MLNVTEPAFMIDPSEHARRSKVDLSVASNSSCNVHNTELRYLKVLHDEGAV